MKAEDKITARIDELTRRMGAEDAALASAILMMLWWAGIHPEAVELVLRVRHRHGFSADDINGMIDTLAGWSEFEAAELFSRRAAGRSENEHQREAFNKAELILELSIMFSEAKNTDDLTRNYLAMGYPSAGILAQPGMFGDDGKFIEEPSK